MGPRTRPKIDRPGSLSNPTAAAQSEKPSPSGVAGASEMHLQNRVPWGGGGGPPTSGGNPAGSAAESVGEMMESLERRRLYREVTLALRSGLRVASADFSFLRLRGLRILLKSLQSIANSDAAIKLFQHSQSIPNFQVVPVLFRSSLRQSRDDPKVNLDHISGAEPLKISSPATDSEVALALRVLDGCCLLHKESTSMAQQSNAIKVLLNILSTRGILEQGACLDALLSLMVDSPASQMDFEAFHGIEKVVELIKDNEVDENIRLKCGEFLLLLIGHVNGREQAPLAAIHEDVTKLLGEKCASLIWAASQFGSTLSPEQRKTALQIQARRVLETIDLY